MFIKLNGRESQLTVKLGSAVTLLRTQGFEETKGEGEGGEEIMQRIRARETVVKENEKL